MLLPYKDKPRPRNSEAKVAQFLPQGVENDCKWGENQEILPQNAVL